MVIDLAAAGAVDESYLCMLNDLENAVKGKELEEHSELRTNQGMMNELGVTVLPQQDFHRNQTHEHPRIFCMFSLPDLMVALIIGSD